MVQVLIFGDESTSLLGLQCIFCCTVAGSTALSPGGADGTAQGSGGLSLEGRDHEPHLAPEVLNAVCPTEELMFELRLIVNRTALWLRC